MAKHLNSTTNCGLLNNAFFLLVLFISVACQSGPKRGTQRVLVHGHRGSRGTHPENTLPAFQEAVASTAEVLELDLHMTKDNALVLSHDAFITDHLCQRKNGQRVTKPIRIRELTLKEIKEFDCGSIQNPRFPEQKQIPGTQFNTLDELMEWVMKNAPTVELNIETKMDEVDPKKNPDPAFFVKRIVETLSRYDYIDRSILQSFDFRTLEAAKPLTGKLRRAALFETDKKFCHKAVEMNAHFASPSYDLLTEDEVEYCHEHGVQVAPWTVNDEAAWGQVIDLGVDAIITDYPRKLVSYLSERARNGRP